MAGKKETAKKTTASAAKKTKHQEPEVVSDEEIDDAVVSDSEESESYETSLNSELQTKIEKSRKIEANQSIIPSKKGAEFDTKTVSESESEDEEDEEVGDEEVEESEGEEVEKSEGEEEEEEEEESGSEEVEESEGEKEENVKKIKKVEKNNGGEKLKGKWNGKMSDSKPNGKWKGKEIEKNESESESGSGMYKLPMRRISRIIKDESPDMRITHEATFLINKATEKFLELLAREAYVCAFLDRKNQVAYKHLSSAAAKRSRFDFLSDFVPEKVKAEVALANLPMNEK